MADEKVQGLDLAYTIQGWLKGVNDNTLDAARDIGKDAVSGYLANVPEIHTSVAKDAFGYTLNYFNNDYAAISQPIASNQFEATVAATPFDVANSELFNGNIKNMVTAINGMTIYGNAYHYDQLNRLRTSTVFNNVDVGNNSWATATSLNDYYTDITYDANGNIQHLLRNGTTAPQLAMDNMAYTYYTGTNQLAHVADGAVDHASYTDIKQGMAANNYTYDAIGNLVSDPSEQIAVNGIQWTVYGKVKSITRTATAAANKPSDLEFKYDAMGNRIMKLVKPRKATGVLENEDKWTYNYYQYDAGGNLLAIYEKTFTDLGAGNYQSFLKVEEMNLYGSSRLGVGKRAKLLVDQTFTATFTNNRFTNVVVLNTNRATEDPNLVSRTLNNKAFELSNHLGNVLATVSDKKLAVTGSLPTTNIASGFEGGDYPLFETGDYSSLQVTNVVNTGTYALSTTPTIGVNEPQVILRNIKDGDVIVASIWANILAETTGGSFILELKDGCTMQNIASFTQTAVSTNPINLAGFQELSFNYTVPTTGADKLIAVLRIFTPAGVADTYWDDLTAAVTHNTTQVISYTADIQSRQMYYAFGMVMPNGNNLNIGDHTYGFNGMEKDDEVSGVGNSLDFGARMYNSRLGRWFATDDYEAYYSSESPYEAMANNPIAFADYDGKDITLTTKFDYSSGKIVQTITITGIVSFDHLNNPTTQKQREDYVNGLNSSLKETYGKDFENINVNFESNFRLGADEDIKPHDHTVFVMNLHSGPDKLPKTKESIGGFVNKIGGRKAYFPRSRSFQTAVHEVGHWLGLFHPKDLAENADYVGMSSEDVFNKFSGDNVMHHPGDPGTTGGENFDEIQAELIRFLDDNNRLNSGDNSTFSPLFDLTDTKKNLFALTSMGLSLNFLSGISINKPVKGGPKGGGDAWKGAPHRLVPSRGKLGK